MEKNSIQNLKRKKMYIFFPKKKKKVKIVKVKFKDEKNI